MCGFLCVFPLVYEQTVDSKWWDQLFLPYCAPKKMSLAMSACLTASVRLFISDTTETTQTNQSHTELTLTLVMNSNIKTSENRLKCLEICNFFLKIFTVARLKTIHTL